MLKMRGENSNWFTKWEGELPSPEELTPLSQTLITPNLAIAFDLQPPNNHNDPNPVQLTPSPSQQANSSAEDEPSRTLKRPRLVWTPELHTRFMDAVDYLGIKNAVPKTIMQLMNVDGLTRENVASHLQKYRLYLNKQNSSDGGNVGGSDNLFWSSPVPAHFLHQTGNQSSDHFVPILTHHQQQQIAATHLQPPQFLHQQISISPTNGKATDQSLFMARQTQQQVLRDTYAEDLELGAKTALTLFPTRDD